MRRNLTIAALLLCCAVLYAVGRERPESEEWFV